MSVDIQCEAQQLEKRVSGYQQQVLDIVRGCQMAGAKDMTAKEIQRVWESKINGRLSDGTVSGAVAKLKAAGYLVASEEKRQCLVTGETKFAWYAPMRQGRLA